MKNEWGRREWARKEGMRGDSWDALASKKWVKKWTLDQQVVRGAIRILRLRMHGKKKLGKQDQEVPTFSPTAASWRAETSEVERLSDGEESEVECEVGNVAPVWDDEIAGMARGLVKVRQEKGLAGVLEKKVPFLPDSKAAIAAVKRAGRSGKARSRHLERTVNMIAKVRGGGGKVGWVKAHMSILGYEAADVCAKQAAEGVSQDDDEKWMSGGL